MTTATGGMQLTSGTTCLSELTVPFPRRPRHPGPRPLMGRPRLLMGHLRHPLPPLRHRHHMQGLRLDIRSKIRLGAVFFQ